MASFTPVRGTRTELNATSMIDGQFLFETDQGVDNRIYADIVDASGDLKRVQVGGDRGEGNKLSVLKDVKLTTPASNDYLRYDASVEGGKWVNDKTLAQKISGLDSTGKILSSNVYYDATKERTIKEVVDEKIGISNPESGSYIYWNGSQWVGDAELKNKVQRLDADGNISGSFVKYNATTTINQQVDSKITLPDGGVTGDSLVLGVGRMPVWANTSVSVYDGLDSTSGADALSANQGRIIKSYIDSLTASVAKKQDAPENAGSAGQSLVLNEALKPVWKTIQGGGGGGTAGFWDDVEGKPFDIVATSAYSTDNPDFKLQEVSVAGTTLNMLRLEDENVYRPNDTTTISDAAEISYIPCSVDSGIGTKQNKRKISWEKLISRIKATIFTVANTAAGDMLVYDTTDNKWHNKKVFTLTTPAANDMLVYNATDSTWHNDNTLYDKITNAAVLDSSDTPANNDMLVYDGTAGKWKTNSDLHNAVVVDDSYTPQEGDTLIYTSGEWKPETRVKYLTLTKVSGFDNKFSLTDTTYIGGTDDYALEIYCTDSSNYITSQSISGNTLTVEFKNDVTGTVKCRAEKY